MAKAKTAKKAPAAAKKKAPKAEKKAKDSSLKTTVVDTPPRKTHAEKKAALRKPEGPVLRGLRTVVYQVDDLARAKEFYITLTGKAPYFDQPFYVGFDVEGSELGLDPDISDRPSGPSGSVAYWRVDNLAACHAAALAAGAQSREAPRDVGGGITVAILADPFGNDLGLIEMP